MPEVDLAQVDDIHPHSDAALVKKPAVYAEFIADMWDAGMVTLGSLREANVGIFFVPKKDGRQCMVLDTWRLNQQFAPPAHSCLPSAAAFGALHTKPGEPLWMAQMEVENAFA